MDELIYYPGFEIRRIEWLKFALLYIDKLDPIIPPSGDSYLSNLYKRLINETDLINVHRPTNKEGATATLDALEFVERVLRTPDIYSLFFGKDFINRWEKTTSQDFIIFNEKYTRHWEDYCINNRLGTQCEQGIRVHEQLASLYMTLLAQAIADSRGLSPITDDPSVEKLYIVSRRPASALQEQISIARGTLKIQLPTRLSQIDISDIIKLRNSSQFKQNLKAFHVELKRFLDSVEQGATSEALIRSLASSWKDFSNQIVILSAETTSFGLGLWLVMSSPMDTPVSFVKELASGISLIIGSTIALRKTWTHTAIKRNARRYLADVAKLTAPLFPSKDVPGGHW